MEPSSASRTAQTQLDVIKKYCVTCHNQRLKTAGLILDEANIEDVRDSASVWEKVLHKVRMGEMPPAGMPRPDKATFNAFADGLKATLDSVAAAKPNPGKVALHRLSRTEYVNAIRDMLALEIDGRSLLIADDVDQHGFDNIASELSVSPALMDEYLSAARKISRLATGDPTILPVVETYNVSSTLDQAERMSEDLPFGSRGGIALRHHFPLDGEYDIKVRLQRTLYGYIRGLGRAHELEVRVNGKLIKLFTVGGDAPPGQSPMTWAGAIMGDPKWDLYMHDGDKNLEVRFAARAGTATVGVSFISDAAKSETFPQPRETGQGLAVDEMYLGEPGVESVAIGGPRRVDGW